MDQSKRQAYFDYLVGKPNDADGVHARKKDALDTIGGTCLYKYCGLDTARKILASGLLLQPPDNFNDPFDCLAGVSVWNSGYRFAPEPDDLQYALSLIRQLPAKYQLPNYNIFQDMRSSYCFAITCFGERWNDHLMWSHYADNHKGVCLAFDVSAIIDDIHPCVYTHSMPPELIWRSSNIALSLIKGSAWAYEREWRFVKKTIRPKMRVIGSITHQIYNSVHANQAFSKVEHEEWGRINSDLMRTLENTYNEERIVRVKPSRIYLGLNFGHHYTNVHTGETCDAIRQAAADFHLPVSRMRVQPNSFDLFAADVTNSAGWIQP
jgi:hypothetical protein